MCFLLQEPVSKVENVENEASEGMGRVDEGVEEFFTKKIIPDYALWVAFAHAHMETHTHSLKQLFIWKSLGEDKRQIQTKKQMLLLEADEKRGWTETLWPREKMGTVQLLLTWELTFSSLSFLTHITTFVCGWMWGPVSKNYWARSWHWKTSQRENKRFFSQRNPTHGICRVYSIISLLCFHNNDTPHLINLQLFH